jgi:hypothetical protein
MTEYLFCAKFWALIFHPIFYTVTNLRNVYFHYAYLIDEETEAQKTQLQTW